MIRSRLWLLAIQAAIFIVVVGAVMAVVIGTSQNLDRLGIQSGFDFLFQPAGFDLSTALLPFTSTSPIYMALLVGIVNTLVLTFLAIAVSTVIAIAVAFLCMSSDRLLRAMGWGYVEVFRNIPALLQIFFWYFVVLRALPFTVDSFVFADAVVINNRGIYFPAVDVTADLLAFWEALGIGILLVLVFLVLKRSGNPRSKQYLAALLIVCACAWAMRWLAVEMPALGRFGYEGGWALSPELCALVLGLAVYNASYIAEIIRSGIVAVPQGQREAASALGFSPVQIMALIIAPQALRIILPPISSAYLNVLKASSLGAAVAYPEVVSVMVGTTNNIVGRPIEIMALTLVTYLSISLAVALLMHRIDRRVGRSPML